MTPTAHPTPRPDVSARSPPRPGTPPQPHDLLGQHPTPGGVTVRVLKPLARVGAGAAARTATSSTSPTRRRRVDPRRSDRQVTTDYRLLVAYADGIEHRQDDPYRFLPTLGEIDLHLINEGRHEQLWNVLGAQVHHYHGADRHRCAASSFAVWAPSARRSGVVGDFNGWDGRNAPHALLGSVRRVGAVRARRRRGHALQVRDPRRRRLACGQGRPDGPVHRGRPRRPAPSCTHSHPPVGRRRRGWASAAAATRTTAR